MEVGSHTCSLAGLEPSAAAGAVGRMPPLYLGPQLHRPPEHTHTHISDHT